ncbi:hypothetical protein [Streptomyces sp. WAC04114]|uniref:hypothetical protein n=1 Tax=Streptomyces sp. WAC04114 TaxID=2867961 RepID=UPI001C8CD040|nr:hypothetical protein [Streptomyces sp. WAC04114]MBX9363214.1 hypothetical protein [Streptomyces sp. WAC04114]
MDNNDTRRRTTTDTEDAVESTAYARLLKLMQEPADYWDRPDGEWGPRHASASGIPASTARADANSAYRLATRALRRGELDAARAAFTLALTEQHPGAAFRVVLTEPRRLRVFIPTGGGKTASLVWVMEHLMAAARWGHADAQQLLNGIQARPPRTLEQILADAQRHAPAAGEGLWSRLTFTCPPLTYEAQDDEFYPTVRDVLARLLKAPTAALEAGPSSRARALPAGRTRIALPPASSGISRKPLDVFGGSRSEGQVEKPAVQDLKWVGTGEHAPLVPFIRRSPLGKAALLRLYPDQWRTPEARRQDLAGEQLLRSTAEASQGNAFRTADGVMPVVHDASFPGHLEGLWEGVLSHAVVILTEYSEAAWLSARAPKVQNVPVSVWASSARSAFGLGNPLTECPRARPASAWTVTVAADGSVRVWDPASGLLINCLKSDRHAGPGRIMPVGTDRARLPLYDPNSPTALLECPPGEIGWLNAVMLQVVHPGEREVVFAYTVAAGRTWEEAAAVLGVRDPAAVGEQVRRKVKRLAAEQQSRTAQRRVEYPGTSAADPGPSRLDPPVAAILSML